MQPTARYPTKGNFKIDRHPRDVLSSIINVVPLEGESAASYYKYIITQSRAEFTQSYCSF